MQARHTSLRARRRAVRSAETPSVVGHEAEPNSERLAQLDPQARDPHTVARRGYAALQLAGVALGSPSNRAMLAVMRAAEQGSPGNAPPAAPDSGGVPLPRVVQERMERAFGHPFDHVRIHTDGAAADSAAEFEACAYAVGSHVYFGQGRWAPGTETGDRLIAHELTHVVQSDEGRLPSGPGVSSPTDPAEREAYANEGRILGLLDGVDWGLDAATPTAAPPAPAPAAPSRPSASRRISRDPERDDEDWTPGQQVPPEQRYTLNGSTHRFGALLHIYQSGDFGEGGLGPETVVTTNGMTLHELYVAYREGRISATNAVFSPSKAAGMVESIRRSGFVMSDERARELGLPLGEGGFDGESYAPVRIEEPGSRRQPMENSIDEQLSGDGARSDEGLRRFIRDGVPEGGTPREVRRDRNQREQRLGQYEEGEDGQWRRRDGRAMTDEERMQLSSDLVERARDSGLLRGEALERYRERMEDPSDPPISARRWSSEQRALAALDAETDATEEEIARRRGPPPRDERDEPLSPNDPLDPRARRHILDSDETGGGHGPGTFHADKSQFPSDWTEAQIADRIADVRANPDRTERSNTGNELYYGLREGVEICVVYDPEADRIVSAYPNRIVDPHDPTLPDGRPNLIPAPRTGAAYEDNPQHESDAPADADELRSRIAQRRRELEREDPAHPGRTETERELEAIQLDEIERRLEEGGDGPENVRALGQRLRDERIRALQQAERVDPSRISRAQDRSDARERTAARMADLAEGPDGSWTHRDGRRLNNGEIIQLRRDLVSRAEQGGLLEGPELDAYRRDMNNRANPPLSVRHWRPWREAERARMRGPGPGPSTERESEAATTSDELRRRITQRQGELEQGDPAHPGRTETERELESVRLRQIERELGEAGDDPDAIRALSQRLRDERTRAAHESGVVARPTVPVDGERPSEPPRRPAQGGDEGAGQQPPSEDEDPVRLPTRSPLRGEEAQGGDEDPVELGDRSATIRRPNADGSQSELELGGNRHGGNVQIAQQGPDGSQRSLTAGVQTEQRGDRTVGGDLSAGGGGRRVHGSLTVGGTYWADPPRRDGERLLVNWEIQARGGGSFGGRLLRAGMSVDASGRIVRGGTNVFPIGEGGEEAARARATAFQQEIESYDEDRLLRELGLLTAQSLGDYEWWTSPETPVGTARSVEVGGTIGGSISARVATVGATVQTADRGAVRKTAAEQFEVEVVYQWESEIAPGGSFGVGATGGFGLFDNAHLHREARVYRVTLPAGEAAFRSHLAREAVMHEQMAGVELLSSSEEDGDLESNHVDLLVADINDRRGVTVEERTDEQGNRLRVHRAYVEGSGSAIDGAYFRHGIQFEAPEAGANYRFTLDHHDTDDQSSGNWAVVEEYTQEQMRAVQQGWLQRYEEAHPGTVREDEDTHPAGLTIYERVYNSLSITPPDASGDAERARIFSALIAADGDRAYQIIRDLAGGPCATTTQLFTEDERDESFLSSEQRAALEQRIGEWEAQISAAETGGAPLSADVISAIAAEREAMRVRRDAVSDEAEYRDLPVDRGELVADYTALVDRLDALHTRAARSGEGAATEGMSASDYAAYEDAVRARTHAERREAAALERQAAALALRRPGNTSGLEGRFTGARQLMEEGRAAMARGETSMPQRAEQVRMASELAEAKAEFESAARSFQSAEDIWRELVARLQPQEGIGTEPVGDGESSGGYPLPQPGAQPRPRPRRAREQARPEQQPAQPAQPARRARQPAREQGDPPGQRAQVPPEGAPEEDFGPPPGRREVVLVQDIDPLVTVYNTLGREPEVNRGELILGSGIVIQALSAQRIPTRDGAFPEGTAVCLVRIRILQRLESTPDMPSFEVVSLVQEYNNEEFIRVSDEWVPVQNRNDESFRMLVLCHDVRDE